jgi:NADPH:quinone reductase-like Zn-dependent oxidoreductase
MGHLWHEEALLIGELREVLKGVEEGAFRPIIDSEVPFSEARRAHERLTQRGNFGKVVLVP